MRFGLTPEEKHRAALDLRLEGVHLFAADLALVYGGHDDGPDCFRLVELGDDGEDAWIWGTFDVPRSNLDDEERAAAAVAAAAPLVAALRQAGGM